MRRLAAVAEYSKADQLAALLHELNHAEPLREAEIRRALCRYWEMSDESISRAVQPSFERAEGARG
jgi:hypothetical protein